MDVTRHLGFLPPPPIVGDTPPIPLSVSSRSCRLTYIPLNATYSYWRFIYCNKQGQTPLRMRIDPIFVFCRWWDTYIKPQSCFSSPQVYYASSTAKTRTKRHCACVWTRLQMVGHIYRTTSLPNLVPRALPFCA